MSAHARQIRRRTVTLSTIAERAGVHPSTVSRALQRKPDHDEATARIWTIARELDYVPDMVAASLRTGQSRAIGVLVHRLTDIVQALIFEAVEETCHELGYQALVGNTYDNPQQQRQRAELMVSRRVEGLILADAHLDGKYVAWAETLGVPIVLVSRRVEGKPAVTLDELRGGRLAGEHLADLGHRHVGILTGPSYSSASSERVAGCIAGLRDRGIDVPPAYIEPSLLDAASGAAAMESLIGRAPQLTAVFAVNDFTALGAANVLKRFTAVTGREFALVGYNDVSIAESADLTTISSPHRVLGSIAMRQLADALAGGSLEDVRIPPELKIRGTSVAAAPAPARRRAGP